MKRILGLILAYTLFVCTAVLVFFISAGAVIFVTSAIGALAGVTMTAGVKIVAILFASFVTVIFVVEEG